MFDQFDDTRSQVYGGLSSETNSTNQAVEDTSGKVVTYKGKVATTFALRKRVVSLTAKGRETDEALRRCMERSPAGFGELATSELVTFRDLLRRVAGES